MFVNLNNKYTVYMMDLFIVLYCIQNYALMTNQGPTVQNDSGFHPLSAVWS